MSYHDIHQYYFEKYLRNEMSAEDRQAFEEKMSADSSLRKAFAYYKRNRQKFLDTLVIKEERKQEHRKLNSWIYLLISLTGIILAFNFYLDNQDLRSQQSKSVPFYRRIPFIFKNDPRPAPRADMARPVEKKQDEPEEGETDTITAFKEEDDELAFHTDRLLHDTLLYAVEKAYFETRYEAIRLATDSLIADTLLEQLAFSSSMRNSTQSRPQGYTVEFWVSPIHYVGYLLKGKKLLLYGIDAPFRILLFTENDQLILRRNGQESILINDKDFHKF